MLLYQQAHYCKWSHASLIFSCCQNEATVFPDALFLSVFSFFYSFSPPLLDRPVALKDLCSRIHSEVSYKQAKDNPSESRLSECETVQFQHRHAAKVPARVGHVHSSLLSVLRLACRSHTESEATTRLRSAPFRMKMFNREAGQLKNKPIERWHLTEGSSTLSKPSKK